MYLTYSYVLKILYILRSQLPRNKSLGEIYAIYVTF